MNRMFKRSSTLGSNPHEPLQEHKQKTLTVLLWVFAIFAVITVVFVLIVRFAAPNFLPYLDQQFFLSSGIFFFLAILIIILVKHYLSFEVASLLFNLLFLVGIFFSDPLPELVDGRSLILLILPVVTASVLLRPWAGLVVAGFFSFLIIIFHVYYHLGLPNIPAILALILVAFIIQQATSNLEKAMKQLELTKQALQEKEERFRLLIESTTDVNAILSRDGKVNYVSPSIERLLGHKAEDLAGVNIFDHIHPDDISIVVAALGSDTPAVAIGPMLVVRLHHKNGSWVTVEAIGKEMYSHPAIQGTVINLRDITERKQVETALRDSEEKFSKAFHLSPTPMAISSMDGRYIEINQSFVQTFGFESEELIGRTPSEMGIFVDPDQNQKAVQILKEHGKLRDYEMRVQTRSGQILYGIFFAETLLLNGCPLVLILMNDITERKRVEDELRESEEKYHRLIETLPIGIAVHQGGTVQLMNNTGARILGAETPLELIGIPFINLSHPDYRELIQERIRASLAIGVNAEPMEEKLLRLDGTIIDVEVVALPIKFKHKPSMLVMFEDITERKQSEEALKKSEENFRNLSENTADAILIGAPDGRHLYANRQASKLFGYSPEEMIRTSQVDLADPKSFPFLKKRLQDRIAGRPVPKTYETNLFRKDGTNFLAEITGSRTVWQDQTCDLVLVRDITERKQAQEAIRVQNQRIQEVSRQLVDVQELEKHRLASELHDDLGQSLTSLKLMLELASSMQTSNKRQKVMKNSLELVSELMGKVRNLSLDLRPAMLDDFGLFAALRWLFERLQTQTGIAIQCNNTLDSHQRFHPSIETAAFRIAQEALTNIARYAGVKEAQVNLEVGETLSIEVVDKGAGFNYAHPPQETISSGGISGMQERARLLGGMVKIISEIGIGTRVVATLPLAGGIN